jgi:serine/threonine protein kinase
MYSADNYYIFMDYCEGGTLYDLYVSKKGRYFEEE